jgi:DNA-binding YbaB/EbfC family protein
MFDIQKMIKQAQKMQEEIGNIQEELGKMEIEGVAGGGKVKLRFSGKFDPLGAKIDPELLKSGDAEMLEDLIMTALKDANEKIIDITQKKMSKVTAGLPKIPGLKLPF